MKKTIINKEKHVNRGGTGRKNRALAALQPDYIQVDERDTADLLITTHDYAGHLVYFNQQNEQDGTWLRFLEANPAYLIANLTKIDLDQYLRYFNTQLIGKAKDAETLKWVFDFMLSLALAIERQHMELPPDNGLQQQIRNIIFSRLGKDLEQIIAIYKAVVDEGLIDKDSTAKKDDFPFDVALSQEVLALGFSRPWYLHRSAASWGDFLAGISPDPDLFLFATTDVQKFDAAADALQHAFERSFRSYAAIATQAISHFEAALSSDGIHQPHVALFITFVKLFGYAQQQINQFTKKHLDFYFRDVLQIGKKPSEPAKAFVTFELAKNQDSHLVQAGTLLKAGKDATGKEITFALQDDIVVNRAQVAELRSVFADYVPSDTDSSGTKIKHLHAALVANSLDGAGEEPIDGGRHWDPFGNNTMPLAEVGFAIASPALLLAEGERTLTFRLYLDNVTSSLWTALKAGDLRLSVTGEKGWIESNVKVRPGWMSIFNKSDKSISFSCTLGPDDGAIVSYDPDVHDHAFDTRLPVARVVLSNSFSKAYRYAELRAIQLNKATVRTDVQGLEGVIVETSSGNTDASKPFLPLSATPSKGDYFTVGAAELEGKMLRKVEVRLKWKEIPEHGLVHKNLGYFAQFCDLYDAIATNFNFRKAIYKVDFDFRKGGIWQKWPGDEKNYLFNGPDFIGMDIINGIDEDPTSGGKEAPGGKGKAKTTKELTTDFQKANFEELLNYSQFHQAAATLEEAVGQRLFRFTANSAGLEAFRGNRNLFRFTLRGGASFGHREYPGLLAKAAIKQNLNTHPLPEPPVTPEVAEITLNYTAVDSIELAASDASAYRANEGRFFHIHPFGEAEAHAHLNQSGNKPLLLPDYQNEGSLFIGIADLRPPQNLALLFQLAEGSEDPLKDNPELNWSYLTNNQWRTFESNEISDGTGGLIKSGIVRLSVPKQATADNTILPPGMHWIRVWVASDSDGLCRIVDIQAQAALTVMEDNGNDPALLEQALEPGTITGLKEKDARVKSVTQPFNSFDGRPVEADSAYYTRVSERLRHKERAVALWDYEHLVLEHFPAIYKVKCLPNTLISKEAYSEKSPGHVGLVTVPNLVNGNASDPLNPYTPKSVREDIQEFLDKRHSGAAILRVDNPLFEQVQVETLVTFHEGFDETFYANKLREDITRFLAPWAFADSADIEFGGRIYKSVLIDYVEELEYVDFLTAFRMNHWVEQKLYKADQDEIIATTGRSVLVPHHNHKVNDEDIISEPTNPRFRLRKVHLKWAKARMKT